METERLNPVTSSIGGPVKDKNSLLISSSQFPALSMDYPLCGNCSSAVLKSLNFRHHRASRRHH